MILAIKRHTGDAVRRGRAKRYQRRCPSVADAMTRANRWLNDPDVKAVWVFDGNREVMHAIHPRGASS